MLPPVVDAVVGSEPLELFRDVSRLLVRDAGGHTGAPWALQLALAFAGGASNAMGFAKVAARPTIFVSARDELVAQPERFFRDGARGTMDNIVCIACAPERQERVFAATAHALVPFVAEDHLMVVDGIDALWRCPMSDALTAVLAQAGGRRALIATCAERPSFNYEDALGFGELLHKFDASAVFEWSGMRPMLVFTSQHESIEYLVDDGVMRSI